jgi:MFS family permease
MTTSERRLLLVLGLALVFEGYGRSLIPLVLPYVGRELAAEPPSLSYALAVIATGSLAAVVVGPFADRFGRRRLVLASVAAFSLLGAATAFAGSLTALVGWQLGARIFQEAALFSTAVVAAEEMPLLRRGVAQGILGTANTVGAGFASFLLGEVTSWPFGWRGLCLVSLAPFAFLPFLRRALPEGRRWLAQTERGGVGFPPPPYRGRLLAAIAVVFLSMSYDVAGFAFATYVPTVHYGWSPAAVSAMFVIAGGVGTPGFWIGGHLADRWGRRGSAAVFLLGLTLAEVVFYLGEPSLLWPAFAVMVFCQGGKMTVLRAWTTELFPTRFRGAAAGWVAAGGTLGAMTGLGLVGALGPVVDGVAHAVAVVSSAGVAGAAAALLWLPETRGLDVDLLGPDAVLADALTAQAAVLSPDLPLRDPQ